MDKELLFAFIRTIIALPVVVGLAYVLIKYGLARRGLSQRTGQRRMRVVEQLPLGKGLLYLVQVGDKYYLLAQAESSFTKIKEFDTLPDPLELETGDTNGLPDFRRLLNISLKKHQDNTKGEQDREK